MFAERLKELRKKHHLTQEQLAPIIGVERSSIGKYEGKSRTIPSDDVKLKIAEYFGVTVDYLMGYTDDPHPSMTDSRFSDAERQLINGFRDLNKEGQGKVLDYIDDLVSSGNYIKTHPAEMVQEA